MGVGSLQVLYVVAAPSARQPVDRVDLVGQVDLVDGVGVVDVVDVVDLVDGVVLPLPGGGSSPSPP